MFTIGLLFGEWIARSSMELRGTELKCRLTAISIEGCYDAAFAQTLSSGSLVTSTSTAHRDPGDDLCGGFHPKGEQGGST
jgi:hypothetical protein